MRLYYKLITAFLLFSSTLAYGQQPSLTRGDSTVRVIDYRQKVMFNLAIPTVVDTAHGLHNGKDELGLIIQIIGNGKQYKRDTVLTGGHIWTEIGSGTGGSTDTTSLSNRINAKKDKSDSVSLSGYSTNANRLKLADSLTAIFNSLFKLSTDSVRLSGYTTIANKNKLADSLTANFNALISLYKLSTDSVRLSGYTTIANKNKLADSLTANFNALLTLYKLKADSVVPSGYTTVAHTNKVADSLRAVFNNLLLGKVDTGTKANIYFQKDGGRGIMLGRGHDSVIALKGIIDSGAAHVYLNPDSTVTVYVDPAAAAFDSAATQGGGFHTDGFNQGKYIQIKDSTSYATFKRLYKTLDSLNLIILHKGDSSGVGYTTLARTRKVIDSLGAVISASSGTPAASDGQIQINNSGAFGTVTNLKVNKTTGTLNSDSSRTHLDYIDSSQYTNLGGLLYPTTMSTFDNSIGVGYPYTDTTIRWSYQLASKVLHVQEKNYSVSSTGVATAIANMNKQVNPGHSTFTNFGGEFNDVRQNGLPRPTSQKVLNAMKAAIANQFAKKQVPAGSTGLGVTRYGSWTTPWDATLQTGKFTNAAYTSTANDSLVYQFTDSTVFLVPLGNSGLNGYTGSAFSVYIDNVLQFSGTTVQQSDGKVDVSSYSNDCIPMAFFITGLTNAAHTLKIVKTGSGLFIMDYVGNLVDKKKAYGIMLIQATHMNSTGYATAPANSTQALQDTLNGRIDSLKAQTLPGYPILVSHVNTYFNIATDLYTDGIHPDTLGYYHHYQADSLAVVSYTNTPIAPGMVYYMRNGLHVRRNDNTDARIMTAEDSIGVMNQTAYPQTGGFNVLNHSYIGDKLSANLVDVGGGITSEKNARMTVGWNQFGNLISFYDPTGSTNQKLIDIYKPYGSASLQFRAVLDNEVSANTFLQFNYSGSGNTILNAQFNSTVRANTTSGNGIDIIPYAGEIGVNASSFVVSGTYQHMAANGSASSGLQYYLKNTSSASGAYANGYFESNGTTGNSAPLLTFRSTVWGRDYYAGLDPSDSSFKVSTGNNVQFGAGSTPLFKIDRLGKHYMLQTPATGSSGDSVLVRVTGTGELKWVSQSSLSGGSSMPFSTITTTGSAPSFSLGGAVPTGGGGAPSSMGSGSNLIKGSFQFTSGTGTGTGSTIATFTMPTSATYVVILQPTSPTIAHVYVQHTSGTTWTITLQGSDTIAASTNYSWDYIIMQ